MRSATPVPPLPIAPTSIARTRTPTASIAARTGTTAEGAAPELVTSRTCGSATNDHLAVDQVRRTGAREHRDHTVCAQLGHRAPCLGGSRSDVRRQDQARRGEEARIDFGLAVE